MNRKPHAPHVLLLKDKERKKGVGDSGLYRSLFIFVIRLEKRSCLSIFTAQHLV